MEARIRSKLSPLRRTILRSFFGVPIMLLYLAGSLFRHQPKKSPILRHKWKSYLSLSHGFKAVMTKISLTTPLLPSCVRLRFEKKQPTRRDSMRQQAVIVNNYLTSVVSLYQESSKEKKGEVLDIAELVTQRSRKQLIKRLGRKRSNGSSSTKPPGRPLAYSKEELLPHIRYLWEKMEKISAERMKAAFADWLPRYEGCPPHLKLQMEKISASTLKRYLKEVRLSSTPIKGLSTTSPSKYMKNKVPINTLDSQVSRPGYTQTDTVSHCGSSAQGPFISSLTVTDICTTWTECRAIFTKKGSEVRSQIKAIEKVLPFSLLAINSDSGSEFLNKAVFQFTSLSNIQFTRSRPYKKNDNCYIEQKNFTHVRELFGYERFDNPRF